MNTTTSHSLKLLSKSILNRLENQKFIEFAPANRSKIQDALVHRLSPLVLSDEAISQQVRTQIQDRVGSLEDQNISETSAFQSQRKTLVQQYSDNKCAGFYLMKPLRDICSNVREFLFDNSLIEDVFESDEIIQKAVLDVFQNFDESKIA